MRQKLTLTRGFRKEKKSIFLQKGFIQRMKEKPFKADN